MILKQSGGQSAKSEGQSVETFVLVLSTLLLALSSYRRS
jgi:hypothetical protein